MKYLSQFLIILGFTFLGEALQRILPLPIPASVWGLALLFGALCLKIIKVEQVKEAGGFLTSILPILFVVPLVNLMDCWDQLKDNLVPLLIIIILSTILVFAVSGMVTQMLMNIRKKKGDEDNA